MNTDLGPRQLVAATDVSSSDLGVYTIIGSLMAVGLVLIVIAAWLFKATKPEMDLLAPLERMSDRSWKRLDPAMQRRELDDIRPSGARPIVRSTQVPSVDEDFDKPVPDIATFDDLASMQAADVRRRESVDRSGAVTAQPADDSEGATGVAEATLDAAEATVDVDDTDELTSAGIDDPAATPPHGVPTVVVDTEPPETDGTSESS